MSRKKERVVLKSQARDIITKVYDFMKKEASIIYAVKLTDARWRTSQACGVSESTVTRVLRERRQSMKESNKTANSKKYDDHEANSANTSTAVFKSPMKQRRVVPRKINLAELDIGVIRMTIQNYQNEFGRLPTVSGLQDILKDRVQLDVARNTLRRLLHRLGYRWKKAENHRRVLTEKHDIQMLRFKYLNQIKSHREAGRTIVYVGETYINNNPSDFHQDAAKGGRMIIVHAGSKQGFVPNALLTYKAEVQTGDFRDNITSEIYFKWIKELLIPNLPKDATIVMSTAPYNSSTSEKMPTCNSSKQALQTWLTSKHISFSEDTERVELYDIVLKNKDIYRKFKVDDLLKDHGFDILRPPPNYPELNPIENIWDIAKKFVANYNVNKHCNTIRDIIIEAFETIRSNVWTKTCLQVENIENQYLSNIDLFYNLVINNERDTSGSESDDFVSSNDNDSE